MNSYEFLMNSERFLWGKLGKPRKSKNLEYHENPCKSQAFRMECVGAAGRLVHEGDGQHEEEEREVARLDAPGRPRAADGAASPWKVAAFLHVFHMFLDFVSLGFYQDFTMFSRCFSMLPLTRISQGNRGS